MIDYVVEEEKIKDKIKRMEVGDSVESDHHPLIVTLERRAGKGKEKRRERKEKKGGKWTESVGERIREGIEWEGGWKEGIEEGLEKK